MPPRPPLTSLVLHTWKEHGKPRPFSSKASSVQAAKARISRSMSHDAHLARRANGRHSRPRNCALASVRSISYEEGLTTTNQLSTLDARVSAQQRATAAGKGANSSASAASVKAPDVAEFSPARVACLPTIPELEGLPPPAASAVNVSKLTAANSGSPSRQSSQKKKARVKLNCAARSKGRLPSHSRTHVSLIERSCSFDADLSTIAGAGPEMSGGIAPNL